MKLITALAALSLIAAPAQANRFTSDSDQAKLRNYLIQTKKAVDAKDWAAACTTYQNYYDFRVSIKHHEYWEVAGSQKRQSVVNQLNEATAKLNAAQNERGPAICSLANMTWGKAPLSEQAPSGVIQTNASSVSQNIRSRCEREWGTDYRMVRYCVDQQTEAARSLGL